jgi:lysophospholipase L1-like esterase
VCAIAASREKEKYITDFSSVLSVHIPKKCTKIAIVGDSIIEQLGHYNLIKGKNRKMIAKIGVSPSTFYNNVLMDDLLDYDPDRMYILLGMNSIEGKPSDALLKNVAGWFKKILKECLKENRDMQIIVLPVPPVRPGSTASNSVINKYNGLLKTMASDMKLPYYDYTPEMSEKDGTLKSEYAEGDKMHWKFNGCSKFMELLNAYDKENY